MQTDKNPRIKFAAAAVSTAVVFAGMGAAFAAIGTTAEGSLAAALPAKTTLERVVDRQKAIQGYERVLADARKQDVAPKVNAATRAIPVTKLERKTDELRKDVKKAKREPDFPSPESVGVSQSTLDAIASCESGGDYTTNTGNGFSGAYQFMDSTWQAVGGSTASAYQAAPEEQDYRAALLYSQSGAGQWPVCG